MKGRKLAGPAGTALLTAGCVGMLLSSCSQSHSSYEVYKRHVKNYEGKMQPVSKTTADALTLNLCTADPVTLDRSFAIADTMVGKDYAIPQMTFLYYSYCKGGTELQFVNEVTTRYGQHAVATIPDVN